MMQQSSGGVMAALRPCWREGRRMAGGAHPAIRGPEASCSHPSALPACPLARRTARPNFKYKMEKLIK